MIHLARRDHKARRCVRTRALQCLPRRDFHPEEAWTSFQDAQWLCSELVRTDENTEGMSGGVSEHIQRLTVVVSAVVQEGGPKFFGALPLTL